MSASIGRRFKNDTERLAYAQSAIEHGWSRNVLNIDIETRRLERSGKAVTNFAERLPAAGTDLARQGSSHWRGGIPVDRIAAR